MELSLSLNRCDLPLAYIILPHQKARISLRDSFHAEFGSPVSLKLQISCYFALLMYNNACLTLSNIMHAGYKYDKKKLKSS